MSTYLRGGLYAGLMLAAMGAAAVAGGELEVNPVPPPGENASEQWPGWRGPTRQGLALDAGYPDRWSEGGQNVLWKVEVPGEGHSSPIVWDAKLFLTTSYDNGRRRSVLCFNREDGELLWESFVPYKAVPEGKQGKNSYASSTPATDGQRVYAYFGNHGLVAVDFDGQVVWHDPLGEMSNIFHGVGGSPLLHDDQVILYQDNRSEVGSFLAAFDAATGERRWWTSRDEEIGWSSPLAIRVSGGGVERDEIVVAAQNRVRAYDPATGQQLWHCSGLTVEVGPTPVAGHGFVFACSGRAGPTIAIRPGGTGDVAETHVGWTEQRGSPFIPSPLLYDGLLYTLNDMLGVLSCFDAETGQLVYRARLGDGIGREGISASPVAVDGKLFITADDGRTFVIKAGREYEVLHVNRFESTLASPALVDGRWYIRTRSHLHCIAEAKKRGGEVATR